MSLSRPVFYSALASCFAHSVALGFAATLIVAAPQESARPIQVTFVQRAVPLSVGEGNAPEKTVAPPAEKVVAPIPTPQIQPQPKPKPVAKPQKRSAPPKIVRRPPLPPPPALPSNVLRPANPQEAPMRVNTLNPAVLSDAEVGGAPLPPSSTETEGEEGASARREGGAVAKTSPGRGGASGSSAQPDYRVNPKPPYPMLARRLGVQGVVLLRVQVRTDGSVATVELARSSGFDLLDDSATRTVRESWRFVPARVDGAPVVSWVEVPIRFVLEDS